MQILRGYYVIPCSADKRTNGDSFENNNIFINDATSHKLKNISCCDKLAAISFFVNNSGFFVCLFSIC
jgi:hypothetical protein